MDFQIFNTCLKYALKYDSKFTIDKIYEEESILMSFCSTQTHLNILKRIDKLFTVVNGDIEVTIKVNLF